MGRMSAKATYTEVNFPRTSGIASPMVVNATSRALSPSPSVTSQTWLSAVRANSEPRMLPPHFGLQVQMDTIDRRLFEFYIKNWCPGRSVLHATNLWLMDLAPMHGHEGVFYAIQSLAGIYIYDYLPEERVRDRINQRYVQADEYLTKLLDSPDKSGGAAEAIAITVVLSLQDIILTERRRKKPYKPRWLEGFEQAEHLLQQTDPGTRYWKNENVQYDRLRISQSVIAGRSLILTQTMTALPPPTMDAEAEAARLQQDPNSRVVPITARLLEKQLSSIHQWSREAGIENQSMSEKRSQAIDWVRLKPANEVISSSQDMTIVTAEAWRIAVVIYLQCRLLRLPRNHPEVIANLNDLAQCIRILPTSGSVFTAQAPLLPVFLVGMLATHQDHKSVSKGWFEKVVQTPARSVSEWKWHFDPQVRA
ncbi:hypothetical protein NW762_014576 [Fusarium torreyae]|uniref:Uncharacterized protein n=1 Tax=Fusarium torreyae TaxID=1237075 RepID=A0A9W8V993_9HYPO|nr:hypothetical protein NW762_014576 [Fusarium torreyae]